MDSRLSLGQEAVDRVTGAVQRFAGNVTGREELQREGALHREKADAMRTAREERDRAEITEELTEAEQQEREAADERARLLSEKREQRELEEAEREADAAEQAVIDLTERARNATEADKRRAEQELAKQKKAAERARADAQARAARLSQEATRTEQRAEALDAAGTPDGDTFTERLLARGIRVARLPLTAVEKVTGRQGSDWPPAMGFSTVEASVLQVAGGLLRDEDLVRRARAKQAAVSTRKDAMTKQAQADQQVLEAREREEQQKARVEQAEQKARKDAAARQRELDEREEQQREQVARTEQRRKSAARQRAAKAEEGHRNRERTSALADAEGDQKAAVRKKTAARATSKVVDLDEKIDAAKQARK